MKQKRIKDKLSWIPVVFMIAFILFMSSQEGDTSTGTSREITIRIAGLEEWVDEYESLHELIRALAHYTEYMLLSFSIGFAVGTNGFRGRLKYIYMLLMSLAVSCLDEFYQVFVPGRYGDLSDVATDFAGALTAVTVVFLLSRIFRKKQDTPEFSRREFMGIPLDNLTFDEAAERIMEYAGGSEKRYILTANADHIVTIQKDEKFREIYKHSDMSVIDGAIIMWIAESLGCPFKERATGADLFPVICERAGKEGRSVFILGSSDQSVQAAEEKLKEKYGRVSITGHYSPPMEFEEDAEETKKAIKAVNEKKPDILVLALGSPKQEKFLYRHFDELDFKVALPFGAAVDFLAGTVSRAPLFMRRSGFEWLYRFFQEPGRMFKRYFVNDTKIFYYAWKYRYDIRDKF